MIDRPCINCRIVHGVTETCVQARRRVAAPEPGPRRSKVIDGLKDAIAFAQGDKSRGTLTVVHVPKSGAHRSKKWREKHPEEYRTQKREQMRRLRAEHA